MPNSAKGKEKEDQPETPVEQYEQDEDDLDGEDHLSTSDDDNETTANGYPADRKRKHDETTGSAPDATDHSNGQASSSSTAATSANPPEGKRGPGRPKKVLTEEELLAKLEREQRPRRRPGRPKKDPGENEEPPVKRPRGRPRKQ